MAQGNASRTGSIGSPSRPLITICIPTYNRSLFVEAQLKYVINNILSNENYNVNVVVVNNKSTDDTKDRLSVIEHPKYKIVNREVHLQTVEENIVHSLSNVSGEYVWFLSDDDPIIISNFDNIYDIINSSRHDFYIFNSTNFDYLSKKSCLQAVPVNAEIISTTIDRIVEGVGLINAFAGISNIIQRRDNLSSEVGLQWLQTSKIYSHVGWFLESHKSGKSSLINGPLVHYRINDYSDGHWDRVAQRLDVADRYFWSLGIARLLTRMVDRGCLTYRQAGVMLELDGAGARYRLIDDVIFKTYQQIVEGAKSPDRRQHFSPAELTEIRDFCLAADLTPDLDLKFRRLFDLRQKEGPYTGRYVGRVYDFEIYRMATTFVGVRAGRPELRAKTLRFVDPLPDGYEVVVGLTYHEAVERAAEAARQRPAMDLAVANTRPWGGPAKASSALVGDADASTPARRVLRSIVQAVLAWLPRSLVVKIKKIVGR
jgi:glycosyltransferase involved in cell wall biosynthesis